MKFALPIILVAGTVALMVLAFFGVGVSASPVGVAHGSALPGLTSKAETPEQAVTNFLTDVQRRTWDRAFSSLGKASDVDEPTFIEDWTGTRGSLRSLSNLEQFDFRPLHASTTRRRCECACAGLLLW